MGARKQKKVAKVKTCTLPVSELYEYPVNPNEQDPATFERLVQEIVTDGFDEPPTVVPRSVVEGFGHEGYTVVSGNHRLKALQRLEYDEVDCVIHYDWDADTCKLKVMRRNKISGKPNPERFTALVDSVNGLTHDQIAEGMGLDDMEEFAALYQRQTQAPPKKEAADPVMGLLDGLGTIINRLVTEYGDTVPNSFLFFLYGKKVHLTVQSTKRLNRVLNDITRRCVERGVDLSRVFPMLLEAGVEALDFHADPTRADVSPDEGDEKLRPVIGRGES